MGNTKKIAVLIIVLAVIFALIGALVSYDLQQFNMKQSKSISTGKDSLVQINLDQEAKNNNVLVTNRFTGKLEKDATVVAIANDGSMYIVKEGSVLVSDMVVTAKNGETTSVYRINDIEKSVNN